MWGCVCACGVVGQGAPKLLAPWRRTPYIIDDASLAGTPNQVCRSARRFQVLCQVLARACSRTFPTLLAIAPAEGSDGFVFLLSTRAGGQGITLTAADTCIIYDSGGQQGGLIDHRLGSAGGAAEWA